MSSATIDHPAKINVVGKKDNENVPKNRKNSLHKKHKHEETRHHKFGRKRLQSFSGSNGKFFPPYKRRKKEGLIIPPTKFLLGGNICDPLNLNSMQDEEINRAMNAVTPKSSPLPTPKHRKEQIEVIIPPNIHDPLNLINCNDDAEYEKQLISPTKKNSKKRNRKKKKANNTTVEEDKESEITEESHSMEIVQNPEKSIEKEAIESSNSECENQSKSVSEDSVKVLKQDNQNKEKIKLKLKGLDEPKDKRLRKLESKDKIVSPVIPQPGGWKPRLQHRPNPEKKKKNHIPNFKPKNAKFQYGNYNRYYGYRNLNQEIDPRLTVLAQRKHLFSDKVILDIGCNIGHIALSVARDFAVRSVTGIDIDKKLVNIARKNIKHYINCVQSPSNNEDGNKEHDSNLFPISMPINFGPVNIPGFTKTDHKGFPHNVTFVQGNYVLDDDSLLALEQPQFDTICCLSTTKWIHLNFGDAGLKRSFKRMHAQLKPGGVLILEPQSWSSYGKKKGITERTYKNYQNIEFFPNKFTQYLLSSEVGFLKCEVLSAPPHPSKGFHRPIYLFTKANPNLEIESPPHIGEVEISAVTQRERRQSHKLNEQERRDYERDLFPSNSQGNFSAYSQRSNESMSQYDLLEKVYAPSSTPCYDTPVHVSDCLSPESKKMYYVDLKIEHSNSCSPWQGAGAMEATTEVDEESKKIVNAEESENVEQISEVESYECDEQTK